MRLYPKVIPTIAREVVQTLMQDGDVEIETLRISDAEMDDVRGFKMGDEGIEYVIGQIIEQLLISRNVEEVYADDQTLRKKIFGIFKKHLDVDEEIDREARARLKHLQEGTGAWEVEYQKTIDLLRRSRGLI